MHTPQIELEPHREQTDPVRSVCSQQSTLYTNPARVWARGGRTFRTTSVSLLIHEGNLWRLRKWNRKLHNNSFHLCGVHLHAGGHHGHEADASQLTQTEWLQEHTEINYCSPEQQEILNLGFFIQKCHFTSVKTNSLDYFFLKHKIHSLQ